MSAVFFRSFVAVIATICVNLVMAESPSEVVTSVNGTQLKEILKQHGLTVLAIEMLDDQVESVQVQVIAGAPVTYTILCGHEMGIECYFKIAGTNANQEKITKWNKSRFTKAFLDKDGTVTLTYSLYLKNGVTKKTLEYYAIHMPLEIKPFFLQVCD